MLRSDKRKTGDTRMKIMLVNDFTVSIVKSKDGKESLDDWCELFAQALKGLGFCFDGTIELIENERTYLS